LSELFELCKEICGECKGQCCFNFPVYQIRPNGTYHRNYIRTNKHGHLRLRIKNNNYTFYRFEKGGKFDWSSPCAYFYVGGCPKDKQPKQCRDWICGLIGQLLYLPDEKVQATLAEKEIYKQLRKGWI